MISGVSASSSLYSSYAASSAQRAQEAEETFAVPESALRAEETEQVQETTQTESRDPVADSVELSRNYPQMVVGQAYAPLMAQQIVPVAGLDDEAAAGTTLDRRGDEPAGVAGVEVLAEEEEATEETEEAEEAEAAGGANGENLSEEEQAQVKELANRDREVRAHEQAHQAVGGQYAGGASYEYQQGPDGQRYAVGGEVSIDISAERDPQATIAKMQQVKAAAMAPAEPSGQDRAVAAAATATEAQARAELAEESSASATSGTGESGQSAESDESGDDGSAAESAGGVAGSAAESLSSSNNRYVAQYQQQSRVNPYHDAASSAMNAYALPNAYRSIDIVA